MRDPKIVLAALVRNALFNDTVAVNQDDEDWTWEIMPISGLQTQVKVRANNGPPRYFTVRVSETM